MNALEARTTDDELRDLFEMVYTRFHYDFREYSPQSMRRRIERILVDLQCSDVAALLRKLDDDASAFAPFLKLLTVQVSDLFRDPDFYLAFRRQIVPVLATYPSLRLWIPGCATGEEFYSFAILMREEGLLDRTTFYCTDINPDALCKAESGVYALDRVPAFTDNHRRSGGKGSLSLHYAAAYGAIVFDRSLRKRAVFSDHDLCTDSVFAEVQVISCRNVFIYFRRSLQERVLGLFKESLCRRGFLGVGSRESLRFLRDGSAFVDVADTWYQRC